MASPVVTLYSRSAPIIRATNEALTEVGLAIRVNSGPPPPSASFVVSHKAETREMVVMSHRLGAGVALMPEHALLLSSSARARGGLILVGSDHQLEEPNPEEGALF
nr:MULTISPECIES: hypothetical protein [unclassified Rhodococcus (in: high G+C Gram-positive bacteria)]